MKAAILSIYSPTAIALASELGIPIYRNRKKIPESVEVLIRWGNIGTSPECSKVINRAADIAKTADKAYCRGFLASLDIPTPELSEDNFPVIGRRAFHTQGRGFWLCRTPEDVERAKRKGAAYFSAYYPKNNEYRVHVAGGKVILYSIKEGDKSALVWNKHKSDFTFRHIPRGERRAEIIDLAKRAIEAVGLDFGAVDIMSDPDDLSLPIAVVTEINTAPAGSPYMIKKYSEFFRNLIYDTPNEENRGTKKLSGL